MRHFTLIVCTRQPSIPEQHIKHPLLRCDFFYISTLHCVLDWRALQTDALMPQVSKMFLELPGFCNPDLSTCPHLRSKFAKTWPEIRRKEKSGKNWEFANREIQQKWGIREKWAKRAELKCGLTDSQRLDLDNLGNILTSCLQCWEILLTSWISSKKRSYDIHSQMC